MKAKTILFLILLSLWLLAACKPTTLALNNNGGIGGTGISAGRITGFGSIFVNGIEYNVDTAELIRNESAASNQQNFSIGEYVTVEGDINPDGTTGKATRVDFSHSLQGSVTTASSNNQTIEILGQTVRINVLSVFYGFSQLSDLTTGNMVEVSGVQNAQHEWVATSIRKLSDVYASNIDLELKGTIQHVSNINPTFTVGNLTVNYAGAILQDFPNGLPEVGQYVFIKGHQNLTNMQMFASEVRPSHKGITLKAGNKVTLEGVITDITTSTLFAINGNTVITQTTTQFEEGSTSDLILNALIEVDGVVDNYGDIIAQVIRVKESTHTPITTLTNNITDINSTTKTFTLNGQMITVDTTTMWEDKTALAISPMNFSYLNLNDMVEVQTRVRNDGKMYALRIARLAVGDNTSTTPTSTGGTLP